MKAVGLLVIAEIIVVRVILFSYNYYFYHKQGVPFVKPMYPMIGNFLAVIQKMRASPKEDFVPFTPIIKENYGNANPPAILGFMMSSQPVLVINSGAALTDIYLTKNKYFDKDPIGRVQFSSLFGDSIVLAKSDELWSRKRKILSSAFYKEKLVRMTDVIRDIVAETIVEFEEKYLKKPMDVIKVIGDLHMRIILMTAFGINDLHNVTLPYI